MRSERRVAIARRRHRRLSSPESTVAETERSAWLSWPLLLANCSPVPHRGAFLQGSTPKQILYGAVAVPIVGASAQKQSFAQAVGEKAVFTRMRCRPWLSFRFSYQSRPDQTSSGFRAQTYCSDSGLPLVSGSVTLSITQPGRSFRKCERRTVASGACKENRRWTPAGPAFS